VAQVENVDESRGAAGLLRWSVSTSADEVTIELEGELDLSNGVSFAELLREIVSTGPARVAVDVAKLSFLDSSGIRCLMTAARDASNVGGKLVVRHPNRTVARVIEICGLADLLLGEADR
jgi:anti-sigma B factor antagonist